MSFLSAIRVALAALLVNKGRSVLTSLGIVIGISAVIAMVSAGTGFRALLDDRLESVGKNLIIIRPGQRTMAGNVADSTPLRNDDAVAIRKQVGSLLTGVAESQITQRQVSTRTQNWPTMVVGCMPDIQVVRQWTVASGRFVTDDDIKKMASVCILGETVRKKLFADKPDPVGQTVRIDNVQLKVIGVVGPKGRAPTGADQDDQVFVPLTTLQRKIVGEEKINMIVAAVRSDEMTERAKDEINRVLLAQHRLRPGAEDFDVSSIAEIAQFAVVITPTVQILIAVIASVSLIVGGIGIMNIMLVSVTERTREIGIRMAVGATGPDVLTQFLIEAVVLALVGGVLGIILGIVAAIGLADVAGWPIVVSPTAVIVAF